MLVENGEIEKQETLKDTFNKYLHPDAIDKESKEVYKILGNDTTADIFQFSTDLARDAITKVKPSNLIETASVNSLMRLMSDTGEQPIDTFVRFKNDISLWYQEMKDYGLNESEIEVMEEHLLILNGISESQENIMTITMDKRVAGFSVKDANRLRKIIAKSNRDAVADMKQYFMDSGLKLGNRQEILNYVWNVQVFRQLLYSFSTLHVIPYTLVALQEINLNLHYNPIYWQTACLTVNSGGMDDEEEAIKKQSSNYGKVAASIGEMQERNVKVSLPNINKAGFGFTPDIENNAIIFGLKGLVGVGDDAVHTIIQNRPYTSFSDFLTRLHTTKLLKNGHVVQLIKAGCFDEFDSRINIMKQYVNHTFAPRKNLTLASFNTILQLGNDILPDELSINVRYYRYRQHIYKHSIGKSPDRKTKNRLFLLDNISTEFLYEHFSESCIVDYDENTSLPIVAEWLFEKEYDKKMEVVKEWLTQESTLQLVNDKLYQEEWDNTTKNESMEAGEMSSLSYYYTGHELEHLDTEKYDISNFSELSEEPIPVRDFQYKGQTRHEYQISRLAGTILDKDKNRHTVTILTTDGVVVVKMYAGAYSHYSRQISERGANGKKTVIDKSWFNRGNKALFVGFRRGNQFVLRKYRNTIYQHTIALIDDIDENGDLSLTTERVNMD
ncbi:hypothetical protein CIL05_07595 [Virgibacillus profundi]|uniref:Uncharacterized protein n=1 Tax=Virgibacillus profundi TaxID=2024555 RepID=A0A2A2IGR4_9BACI|nr:hypothetical protein CIL05_07595 [Virgibacillus profundi]PXY54497.1 hypothetical protein CIT14_07680 [Virgibacillus profundi]